MEPDKIVAEVTVALAVVSIILAILIRTRGAKPIWAYLLVGAWVLIPPIWFRVEFTFWRPSHEELEIFKYGQELSRGIWVALVVALIGITGIKWKPGDGA